jgi:hypothetical protein
VYVCFPKDLFPRTKNRVLDYSQELLGCGREGRGGAGGELAQTMYAHMNKWINKPKTENCLTRDMV